MPRSAPALAILLAIERDHSKFVFASAAAARPLSNMVMLMLLGRMGAAI